MEVVSGAAVANPSGSVALTLQQVAAGTYADSPALTAWTERKPRQPHCGIDTTDRVLLWRNLLRTVACRFFVCHGRAIFSSLREVS